MKQKTYITDYNCVTPLGFDVEANWHALLNNQSEIKPQQIIPHSKPFYVSKISEAFFTLKTQHLENSDLTRLEQLLILTMEPIIEKNTISDKTLLILSTTKGNISVLKNKSLLPTEVYLYSIAKKIKDHFSLKTKPLVVSNACVSGVMAIAVAKNLLQSDKFDNAIVVAGDEVTEFVMSGFDSFQAVVSEPCAPYDKNRAGINIGEATAAVFIEKSISKNQKFSFEIIGDSSINDANHISGPSRTGEGLHRSIENALKEAKINPDKIDLISAHGTATRYNDEMESIAFTRSNLNKTPLHSLKGYYGHTLGASGLLETVIAIKSSLENTLIPTKNFEELGVSHPINVIKNIEQKDISYLLKTASGFGGCNSAIILKKIQTND